MKRSKQTSPLKFFSRLKWVDGQPLLDTIELYRRRIFEQALFTFDETGRLRFNLVLALRAKKNWKTADLCLSSIYRLCVWQSPGGNQVYTLCNDEDQAGDNLKLGKKIIAANDILSDMLTVKQGIIERKDGSGFWEILPAGDVVGSHGKTYSLCTFDEIHGFRDWGIIEAMQPDPTRPDALMWITSYNSIHHRPGVPLFDMLKNAWAGTDPRLLFSYYAADKTTDPRFESATPEQRANPSMASWENDDYLDQQRRRLPSHKFRRLHLNLPGSPEGSAYDASKIEDAIERGVKIRPPKTDVEYCAFVDMSGGSSDDATLGIAHLEGDREAGRAVLDYVGNQGPKPPFDPRRAVAKFAKVLKEYRCFTVTGDAYAGETFRSDFENEGISYNVSTLSKSQIYEALEPRLNSGRVVLLDSEKMESELLGLIWRNQKIDHPANEHDDWANAAAGSVRAAFEGGAGGVDEFLANNRDIPDNSVMSTGEAIFDVFLTDRRRGGGTPDLW